MLKQLEERQRQSDQQSRANRSKRFRSVKYRITSNTIETNKENCINEDKQKYKAQLINQLILCEKPVISNATNNQIKLRILSNPNFIVPNHTKSKIIRALHSKNQQDQSKKRGSGEILRINNLVPIIKQENQLIQSKGVNMLKCLQKAQKISKKQIFDPIRDPIQSIQKQIKRIKNTLKKEAELSYQLKNEFEQYFTTQKKSIQNFQINFRGSLTKLKRIIIDQQIERTGFVRYTKITLHETTNQIRDFSGQIKETQQRLNELQTTIFGAQKSDENSDFIA